MSDGSAWEREALSIKQVPSLQALLRCCGERLLVRAIVEEHAVLAGDWDALPAKRKRAAEKRLAATMILFSEKELSSRWGVSFLGEDGAAGDRAIVKKQELANRCQELARSYGLSPREEEVLLLLAQRKTVGSIERELFIANGTAKTHIRHIYRKLDIHSRDELSDLLGLFE